MIKITIRRCRTTLAVAALGAFGALYTGCTLHVEEPSDGETAALDADGELAQPEQAVGGEESELATDDAVEPVAEVADSDDGTGIDGTLIRTRPSGTDTDELAHGHAHPGVPQTR